MYSSRTTYSPVKVMQSCKSKSKATLVEELNNSLHHQDFSYDNKHTYNQNHDYNKHKDGGDNNEEDLVHPSPKSPPEAKMVASNYKQYSTTNNNRYKSSSYEPREQQEKYLRNPSSSSVEPSIEEVYISNCCGFSCIGHPSAKNISLFKLLFTVLNFLVFVFGLADLGMGLWFRIDPKVYEIHDYIETQNFTIAGWICLFGGFFACVMSLLGCISAARNQPRLLVFYFITMIFLTLLFVGSLVLLSVYGFGYILQTFLTNQIFQQITLRPRSIEAAQFLDFVQVKMQCCGANSFNDYQELGMFVPTSCFTIDRNYISAPGCGEALRELFDIRGGMAVGFLCGSICSQMMTIVLSALVFCRLFKTRASSKHIIRSSSSFRQTSPKLRQMNLNREY